jgi:RNase P subunit RPR2
MPKTDPVPAAGHLVHNGEHVADLHVVVTYERIVCPQCETVQGAAVQRFSAIWPVYVHMCMTCGFVITESEWNSVEENDDAIG